MSTATQCLDLLDEIRDKIIALDQRIATIDQEMEALVKQGVFDQIPSKSWETRNGGDTKYLRLIFPTVNHKRRKQYVGCDPIKIEAAQAQIERTGHGNRLQAERRQLHQHLRRARGDLMCAKGDLVTA